MWSPELMILVLTTVIAVVAVLLAVRSTRFLGRPYLHPESFPVAYVYSDKLTKIIRGAERNAEIQLTWGARQMLTIPVMEVIELEGRVDWSEVEYSIEKIVLSLADEPKIAEKVGRRRNSVSVIRAFYKRFCNIPPFCSRTDERSE